MILLLGPPGAGKGTQGEIIAADLGIPKVATGDVLRAAVLAGTERGLEAKRYMDSGDLVPDSVILAIMKEELQRPASQKGVVLDGVVRTVAQAEGLATVLSDLNRKLDLVLLFEVEVEQLVARLGSRTVCQSCQTPYMGHLPGDSCDKCGGTLVRRPDDDPEAIRRRMSVYESQTAPVIDWYERSSVTLARIEAVGSVDDVAAKVREVLRAAST